MAHGDNSGSRWLRSIDPRRTLGAGAVWLIVALAATFSVSAAVWVGSIARKNVLEQHVRRLLLETDQLSSDLGQGVAERLDALSATGRIMEARNGGRAGLSDAFGELTAAYPELDWIGIASPDGSMQSARGAPGPGGDVHDVPWFMAGLKGPWLGYIADGRPRSNSVGIGDLAAPIRDGAGRVIGVVAAHLSWRRAPNHPERLTDESDPRGAEAYVLDRDGTVLVGPESMRNRRWSATPLDEKSPSAADAARFERLPDGHPVLVAREPLSAASEVSSLGWQVQLSEPKERVYQRADALAFEILWVSLCLGVATCVLGAAAARQLTARLERLTESVASVGQNPAERIEVPAGVDEVARLGRAFAAILDDLQQERRELQTLSSELERRVAVRTREVERLAEESRYAAIVRERLKIARDLHDTLAHSMMALLSEIRFLRKLQARDPAAVGDELARAEEVAREGLKEARSAITQMRVNAVRETGLGPALAHEFERFVNRTGLTGEFSADPESARFGDERAETILRMAQEALRNVERHAMAARVTMRLRAAADDELELSIEDDGAGFDPGAPHPGHFGLVGLKEQADLIGAKLRIDTAPRRGTKISVTLRMTPVAFAQSEVV
jgi:signal transduction histidine kinase